MPELPEIINLSQQMNVEFRDKTVSNVQVIQEKCINMAADSFVGLVSGKRVESVTSKGKWVFMKLEQDVWLLINLGMGGDVILHENDRTLPEKYQLRMDFGDGRVLTFRFSWFGYVHVVNDRDMTSHKMTARLGITPLRDTEFTQEKFIGLLKGRKGAVKSFLMNQGSIAGIGNVYIQDILFRARIHPDRKLPTLTDAEKSALYRSIMETLEEAVKLRGLAYERDLYNQPGEFKDFLVGYREGQRCPVCGTTIEKIRTGSTASYICPNCQRQKA